MSASKKKGDFMSIRSMVHIIGQTARVEAQIREEMEMPQIDKWKKCYVFGHTFAYIIGLNVKSGC